MRMHGKIRRLVPLPAPYYVFLFVLFCVVLNYVGVYVENYVYDGYFLLLIDTTVWDSRSSHAWNVYIFLQRLFLILFSINIFFYVFTKTKTLKHVRLLSK